MNFPSSYLRPGFRSALCLLFLALLLPVRPAVAQLAGKGTIQGVISDASGAIIPNAEVTITNVDTKQIYKQKSSGSGFYSQAGFDSGTYDVTVSAPGFQTFTQSHVVLDALQTLGVNAKLNAGSVESVTVSDSLPAVNTTDATLGLVLETDTYRELPLQMNNGPRDPTAFVFFTPGVKNDGRYGSFNGGQIDHNETYVEGIAITDIAVQGNNGTVNRGFSVDAVDQFQTQTNGISAAYDGQGIQNYTHKSGTNTYHGSAFEYFRNTYLDTWGFFGKAPNPATGIPKKPGEHQNEYGGTLGGFLVRDKIFSFNSYEQMHFTRGAQPFLTTIPTLEERNGDFSAFGQPIYDPTTTTCNAAGSSCTRQQYSYQGRLNVIDPAKLAPQAKYLQQFLPALPAGAPVTSNFLAGFTTGFNYTKFSTKFDFDYIRNHRISFLYTYGTRAANPVCCDSSGLPQPYTAGVGNTQKAILGLLEDTWTINDHLINQLKYGVGRGGGYSTSPGYGDPKWAATAAGLKGLPPGLASDAFPRTSFGGTNPPLGWLSTNGGQEFQTSWYLLDNLQLVKGRHSLTIGGQYQWLDDNNTAIASGTYYSQSFSSNETGTFNLDKNNVPTNAINTATGASYASFLVGAVDGATVQDTRGAQTTGARYFTFSPFVQDDIRVSQKLTVNVGLRWDLYSPFHEVHDRLTFVDPTRTNPVTGTPGALVYAGSGQPYSCNCRTPVKLWYKNFAPRLGFAYSINDKTVMRASYGINYTHAGGVGGRGGGRNGTGQLGFTNAPSFNTNDAGVHPAFYLQDGLSAVYNPNPVFDPGFGTGYTTTPGYTGNPQGVTYADPYLSRRAPYFNNFSAGFQRELLKNLTLGVDYSGSTGHFLGTGIGRGIYTNQLDPKYLAITALQPLLNAQATPANVALVQAILPGYKLPYANFDPKISIGQSLRPFPQYNGFSDVWGDNGNSNYNSLQVLLKQNKPLKGLTFSVAYTFSKSLSDVHGSRTAYGRPDLVEYGIDDADQKHVIASYLVYKLPFGQHGGNAFVNQLIKGWETSAIARFNTGTPLAITATGCNAPSSGACLPNLTPGFSGPVRINGNYHPRTRAEAATTHFIDAAAFSKPAPYTLGGAPRAAPYGLRGPSSYSADLGVRRTFDIHERLKATFRADVFNIDNHTQFGGLNLNSTITPTSNTFGTFGSAGNTSRDIQLTGRFDF